MGKLALRKFGYLLLIIFTFALTIVSISGAFAGTVNPKQNMFLASVGLILPILLIINVCFIFYWVIRRKWWFILPIIALAANYGYISSVLQFKTNKVISNGYSLKIMTLNARNFVDDSQDDSADDIKNYIEEKNIQIVCFQEYRDHVNGRPERISSFLSNILPYQAITGSIAIFSKFPIVKKDYITFRNSNNCAQWIDIDAGKGNNLRILNVHMQTTGINSTLRQVSKMEQQGININNGQRAEMVANRMEYEYVRRAEQANIISDIIKDTYTPIILCGDFNDIPSSYTYYKLKGRLKDGFKTAGNGYMYTYRGAKGLMRIDYIMHSQSLEGVNYYSENRQWSDHNPVIMELNLPQ